MVGDEASSCSFAGSHSGTGLETRHGAVKQGLDIVVVVRDDVIEQFRGIGRPPDCGETLRELYAGGVWLDVRVGLLRGDFEMGQGLVTLFHQQVATRQDVMNQRVVWRPARWLEEDRQGKFGKIEFEIDFAEERSGGGGVPFSSS